MFWVSKLLFMMSFLDRGSNDKMFDDSALTLVSSHFLFRPSRTRRSTMTPYLIISAVSTAAGFLCCLFVTAWTPTRPPPRSTRCGPSCLWKVRNVSTDELHLNRFTWNIRQPKELLHLQPDDSLMFLLTFSLVLMCLVVWLCATWF